MDWRPDSRSIDSGTKRDTTRNVVSLSGIGGFDRRSKRRTELGTVRDTDDFPGHKIVLIVLLIAAWSIAAAGEVPQEFISGDRRVALIELYTSEGCSSCPPADRWVSRLKTNPALWTKFAPVAFHVDYWDQIGWRDRFARADYGDRQRRYAAESGTRAVYTPGVFRNGKEWHGWRTGTAPILQPSSTVGELSIRIDRHQIAALFYPTEMHREELQLHIVVLGMNLETRVRAGENKGRSLRHDFVVLGMTSVSLTRSGAAYRVTTGLPETENEADSRALVAWVSETTSQAPIQSVGGFLQSAASDELAASATAAQR